MSTSRVDRRGRPDTDTVSNLGGVHNVSGSNSILQNSRDSDSVSLPHKGFGFWSDLGVRDPPHSSTDRKRETMTMSVKLSTLASPPTTKSRPVYPVRSSGADGRPRFVLPKRRLPSTPRWDPGVEPPQSGTQSFSLQFPRSDHRIHPLRPKPLSHETIGSTVCR